MGVVYLFAEKPSVMRDLRAALGVRFGDDTLEYGHAVGHLMRMCPPGDYDPALKRFSVGTVPFPVPKDWNFKYEVGPSVREVYAAARKAVLALPAGSEVVNCCDAGREGELIFWTVFDSILGGGRGRSLRFSRMWAQTMTREGMRLAFERRRPASEYSGLRESAYARQQGDWYLGLGVTRLATVGAPRGVFGEGEPKRCGRVKSPVLGFVVERDRVIRNFVPEDVFSVRGFFPSVAGRRNPFVTADLSGYVGKPDVLGRSRIDPADAKKVFWDRLKALEFARVCAEGGGVYDVSDVLKRVSRKPPPGYDLTACQKDAFSYFGMNGKETLEVLQSLYETRKMLTYPRTESSCFPDDYAPVLVPALRSSLSALAGRVPAWAGLEFDGEVAARSPVFDSSGVSDHFALGPTGETGALASLSQAEADVYRLVVGRCLMAVDTAAVFDVTERTWSKRAPRAGYEPVLFHAKSEVLVDPGWRRWLGERTDEGQSGEEDGGETGAFLPVGNSEACSRFEIEESKTKPPAHFNDKTLLAAMETASKRVDCSVLDEGLDLDMLVNRMKERGLGTPATRAAILDELVKDKYLGYSGKGKSRHFLALPRGEQLYSELRERCQFMISPAVTAEWEVMLYDIQERKEGVNRVLFLEKVKSAVTRARDGFVSFGLPAGVDIPPRPVEGGFVCPKSGRAVMDCGTHWVFPGWPDLRCRKAFVGRVMALPDWGAVLSGIEAGRPVKLDGFKSKAGKSFSAFVVRKDDPKYGPGFGFEFDQAGSGTDSSSGAGHSGKPLDFNCPKSGDPVMDCDAYWVFPGWPDLRCRKEFVGRGMSLQDWGSVLSGIEAGRPVKLGGFKSKAGKPFSAFVVRKDDPKYGPGFGFEF
jgi:DNA topoisomerase-3